MRLRIRDAPESLLASLCGVQKGREPQTTQESDDITRIGAQALSERLFIGKAFSPVCGDKDAARARETDDIPPRSMPREQPHRQDQILKAISGSDIGTGAMNEAGCRVVADRRRRAPRSNKLAGHGLDVEIMVEAPYTKTRITAGYGSIFAMTARPRTFRTAGC